MPFGSYFNAHPEYTSLLGSGLKAVSIPFETEYFRIVVEQGRRCIYNSGWLQDYNLERCSVVLTPYDTRDIRLYLDYKRQIRSSTPGARVRYSVKWTYLPKSGRVRFSVAPPNALYRTLKRKLRRIVAPKVKSLRLRPSTRQSRPLRPNPEVTLTPLRRMIENGPGGTPTFTNTTRTLYERSWSGSRTPGFMGLRKSQLPVNNHSVRIAAYPTDEFVYHQFLSFDGSLQDMLDSYTSKYAPPAEPSHSASVRNKAIRKLISKMSASIDSNLAVDIAQIGQTVRMIGSTTQKLIGSVRALKKLQISKATNILFAGRNPKFKGKGPSITKSVAQNWLELQYGWKPLLNDIRESFNALSTLNEDDRCVRRVTAGATGLSEVVTTFPVTWRLGVAGNPGTQKVLEKYSCRFTVRYRLASPLTSFLAQTGFTNPLNLAWELLPFSFVADWFLPIGPYLETLSAFDGLEFMDGSQTQFTIQNSDIVVDYSTLSTLNSSLLLQEHSKYSREIVLLNRAKLFAFPSSTFPSLKNGLKTASGLYSIDRVSSGVALLRGLFK